MEFRYGEPVHDPATMRKKEPREDYHPLCLTCGYDMRGHGVGRCPECGNTFVYREWERAVKDAKNSIAQVEDLLAWVPWAWKVTVVGILAFLTRLIPGVSTPWQGFARALGFLCGAMGFLLAINVLRVRRVPPWARSHLKVPPDYSSALVGLLGGAALAAAAIFLP